MVTRKDFCAAAEQIKQMPILSERLQTAMQMAAFFMNQNPKFNLGKFLDACEV